MSLANATNLVKSFGPDDIFKGISFSLPRGARIALVGPNGVGKTTLLRILVGEDEPSHGGVQLARNMKLGYLPQEARLSGKQTLWEECLSALEELRAMEDELARLEVSMSEPDQVDEILERYGRLQEEFDRRGGYVYETRMRQVLTGLGFSTEDYKRPISQLSGGQRTRALLARLLLSSPDLLVLDEPTNHLDISAVEWMEGFLSQWEGAALIVSHDRYFLDKVVNQIWEMRPNGLEVFRGNYSAYVLQRQERWDLSQQIFQAEKARLEKEVDYIKRNIAGQNTNQAKGRLRRLSREIQAIELLGFDAIQNKSWGEITRLVEISSNPMGVYEAEHRMRALRGPSNRPPHLHINLKAGSRSGDLVIRTRNLAVGYQDDHQPLFRAPDITLKRGECAAVIGPNGAGKTTFLKTLLNQMPPLEGEVILGASLNIGYFAQAHEDLNPERTPMEEIQGLVPRKLPGEIRDHLAKYLFTGEEVFKKVSTLSGGERGRLALAKLALTQANLLLLDEPTNHLDIPSQETLQEVLADYQGTILLVSHDRYLIDALASQVWEIQPHQAALQVYKGTYTEYRGFQAEQRENLVKEEEREKVSRRQNSIHAGEERRRLTRLREVEGLITTLETELNLLADRLEKPPSKLEELQELGEEYVRIQEELNKMMREWESLHTCLQVNAVSK